MNIRRFAFFVAVWLFLPHAFSYGATLYMEPRDVEIKRGDTIAVAVRLDTDADECVNVVDAVITYPPNIEPVDTSRGNSIFSVWVEEPKINKAEHTITFAGGIPNGYCGRIPGDPRLSNVVVELLFRSPGMVIGAVPDADSVAIDFAPETQVLLNDGFGTRAPLQTYGTNLILSDKVGSSLQNDWADRVGADGIAPEKFSITLERTPSAFSNRYYIVFNTTDKQSGIDHYEVIEEPLENFELFAWGAADAPWVEARSPYVLKDQSLNSTIRVRAIDKAGNEYVATLVPEESQRTLSIQGKVMIALVASVLVLFVFAGVVVAVLVRRRRRGPDVSKAVIEDEM